MEDGFRDTITEIKDNHAVKYDFYFNSYPYLLTSYPLD